MPVPPTDVTNPVSGTILLLVIGGGFLIAGLKVQFPSRKVYGPHGYRALQLVTCGGDFDKTTGHYLSNVIAYTELVSTTPAQK